MTDDRTVTLDGSSRDERPAPADAQKAAPPRVPARFELLHELGRGGTAVVWAARDRTLGRRVAIKCFDRRPGAPERLLHEARTVVALDHPAIVRVHEVDVEHGLLVMELLEGGTLADRAMRSTLTGSEAVALGRELGLALAHAHRAGVLHRDVKPSNVLLDRDGRPRLADFGIAAAVDRVTDGAGTQAFAAPEQLAGEASVASDLFGMGATLLFATTGSTLASLEGMPPAEAVARATRDRRLARVVGRLLAPEPNARFSSAIDVVHALAVPETRRSRALWVMLSLLLSLVVYVGARSVGAEWMAAEPVEAPLDAPLAEPLPDSNRDALDVARTALARNDLVGAEAALLEADPNDPRTLELASLVEWWNGRDNTALLDRLDRALPSTGSRSLLDGLRLLGTHDVDGAVSHFDAYLEAHPDAREGLYGAFEAHWHQGDCERAVALYDRLVTREPDFALGIEHVLMHALVTGRLERVSSLLASSDALPTSTRVLWQARLAMARGRPDEAAELVSRALRVRPDASTRSYARIAWVEAEVARGDLRAARELAREADALTRALLLHAIAGAEPHVELGPTRTALAEELAGHTRMLDLLVTERRGDRGVLEAFVDSTSAEVAAAAGAIVAEQRGELAAASAAWRNAAARSCEGTFRPLALVRAAEVDRRRGDLEGARSACATIDAGHVPWPAFSLRRACASTVR
ncbi:MAG: protein kinase [Myxococcota bacterium]|nr:protein kinase [Myxococcota bacterium]